MSSDPRSRHLAAALPIAEAAACRLGRVLARGCAVAAALTALTVAGCGKKGPPRPPLRLMPVQITDLSVLQRGSELVLDMGYPQTTTAGTPLPPLTAVEVWLAPLPTIEGRAPQVTPAELGPVAKQALTLTGADLGAAVSGDRILVRLRQEELAAPAGHALFFAVRTQPQGGEPSLFSNIVSIVPATPPPPPSTLTVTPEADAVVLSWAPVDDAAAGYRVYRRDAASRGYGVPLTQLPAGTTRHRDTTARYGTRHIYAVTAISRSEPVLESALSPEQEVAYEDRFAPPPPEEVLALAEHEQVRLRWDASAADDVAGYLLFRQEAGGEWRQVTPEPTPEREHLDRGLASGLQVGYRVVAVDRSGNRGEPSRAVSTTVQ